MKKVRMCECGHDEKWHTGRCFKMLDWHNECPCSMFTEIRKPKK